MENDELSPRAHEHETPITEVDLQERLSDIPIPKDGRKHVITFQQRANELYADILLGRAHFLLFTSLRCKGQIQWNLSNDGKELVDEARRHIASTRLQMDNRLAAKLHYVSGFMADVRGVKEAAKEDFANAVCFDDEYEKFEQVRWYLKKQKDENELEHDWDTDSRPSPKRRAEIPYQFGEVSSEGSPPILAPENAKYPEAIDVDGILKKLIHGTGEPQKPRDPGHEWWKHQAEQDARERNKIAHEFQERQRLQLGAERKQSLTSLRSRLNNRKSSLPTDMDTYGRASRKSSIVSQTERENEADQEGRSQIPDITEVAEADIAELRHPSEESSPTLRISTQHGRRPSSSGMLSPATPSPLRKSSLPGDVDEDWLNESY